MHEARPRWGVENSLHFLAGISLDISHSSPAARTARSIERRSAAWMHIHHRAIGEYRLADRRLVGVIRR